MSSLRLQRLLSKPEIPSANEINLVKNATAVEIHIADAQGLFQYSLSTSLRIDGPRTLHQYEIGVYTIQNWKEGETYDLFAPDGLIDRTGAIVTFQPTADVSSTTFSINGEKVVVTVLPTTVVAPQIVAPSQDQLHVDPASVVVLSSNYMLSTEDATNPHGSTDWEISTDPNFENIVHSSYGDTSNLLSWRPE